jgi:Pyruvate/2-oxoacid:ferredoxin oxidoreductase delta subunit
MALQDNYDRLIRYYGRSFGKIPNRDEFDVGVRAALSEADVGILMLVRPWRGITIERLERRAARAGISDEVLHETIDRLLPQGFVSSYIRPAPAQPSLYERLRGPWLRGPSGRVVVRHDLLVLTEIQSRRSEDDAMRRAAVNWMNTMIEDAGRSVPNRTPYKRVFAAEETLDTKPTRQRIEINQSIPDPSTVLTLDTLSEMLRKEDTIAVADCYCRSTKRAVGEGCDHPLRTCLYFGEIALVQLSTGRAEKIDHDEAMRILRDCEDAGLVHTADNNEDRLGVLCNCCACSCPLIRSMRLGGTNVLAPSRFVAEHDAAACVHCDACVEICPVGAISRTETGITIDSARCIGCGLCVSHCPSAGMRMVVRPVPPAMAKDEPHMTRRIAGEVLWAIAKGRVAGLLRKGNGTGT